MGRSKAALPGRQNYRDIRGRGELEGVYARAGGAAMENHRCRHGAQMGSIVMPRARRTWAARRGAVRPGADGARKTSLTVYSEHTKTAMTGDVISLVFQAYTMPLKGASRTVASGSNVG